MRRRLLRRPASRSGGSAAARHPARQPRSSCATSSWPTARRSSRWCARAASCTGRGPTRRSAPTSSTTSSRARVRDDFACLVDDARRGRRHRRRLHDLADRARLLPVRLPRLLRERAPRRQGADGASRWRSCSTTLRPALAPPARGEHPARQRAVDRARPRRRLPAGGLLAALPADRRPLARPRALRDHRRRARAEPRDAGGSEQAELRGLGLGSGASGSGSSSAPATTSGSGTTSSASAGSGCSGAGSASSSGMRREVGAQHLQHRRRVERRGRVVERAEPHRPRADQPDLLAPVQPRDAGRGSPRSSFVAKLPSVQITRGSISSSWRNR